MDGRTAVVTGAGRGIGREAVVLLAQGGARVLATARSADELAETAALAPGIVPFAADLAEEAGCVAVIEEARRALGPVEILVVNHGIGSADETEIWDMSPATWRRTLAINLDAPFHLARLAAADMRAAGWGRIVMTSSTSGEVGSPRTSAYAASKHGLLGLMRCVAWDVGGFGATCNAVLPGWVRTAMADRSGDAEAARRGLSRAEVWAERDALYPRGRSLEPAEIAATIAFLCSEAASGVNGEAITVAAGALW